MNAAPLSRFWRNIFARRAIEIPVHHAEREYGESKYSFMRLINLMYDLVTCLTTTPLRMLSLLGQHYCDWRF